MKSNELISIMLGVALVSAAGLKQLETKFISNNPRPKKILLARGSGIGEREEGHRIEIAAKRLGIDIVTVIDHNDGSTIRAARHYKPDLILTIERNIPAVLGVPNYLVLDQSKSKYITMDADGQVTLINPDHYKFSGLLPTFPDIDSLKQAYERQPQPFYGFNWHPTAYVPVYNSHLKEKTELKTYYGFNWYPSAYATEYAVQDPKFLFYPGGVLTDDTRGTDKYKKIFSLLDQTGYLKVYGFEDRWQHTPKANSGVIPFNGISIMKIGNKHGVTLLLHARDHLSDNVPTGRIFEAVASNTVIISDKNQFIINNFGDNVLYIDISQDAQTVFEQIDDHMQWILANPDQAKQMAQNCHAIFMQNFTMEAQLQKLIDLNDERI